MLALRSPGPHPEIPAERRIFAPFIGSWDLEVTWFTDGSAVRREAGEWHFAWVLEGRAVQDVWIVPPRRMRAQAAELYEYGTSVRFYDPGLDAWRSTWIGPMHGLVRAFVARGNAGGVTLETDGGEDKRLRWVFSDIEPHRFTWRNFEQTADGGWALVQAFAARRASTIPRPDMTHYPQ